MPEWTTCQDCNRVLLREHGPVCPECMAKRPVYRAADKGLVYKEAGATPKGGK